MPVFHCKHCGQPIDADETLAGAEVGCPDCYAVIQVPGAAPTQDYQPYQPPMFAQAPGRSSARDKWRIWAPVLGTLTAFVLCLLKKFSEPPSSLDMALGNSGLGNYFAGAIGYMLAAGLIALVVALVIAGIAAACQKSFLTVLTRSYGIGAVLASLLMLAGTARHRHAPAPSAEANQHTREELNKLQKDIQDMQAGVVPANGVPSSKPEAPLADDAGDMDKIMLISRQYFEEVAASQTSYVAELGKTGFLQLLDAGRIVADKDLSESYVILDRAQRLVKAQGVKMREALSSLPAKIRASNLNPRTRESHAQRAEEGTRDALATFGETWALEESIVTQMAVIIDLLKDRLGHWELLNNRFVFNEDADLALFNAAMEKINEAVTRQNEIKLKGEQNTGKVFDDLRSALPK